VPKRKNENAHEYTSKRRLGGSERTEGVETYVKRATHFETYWGTRIVKEDIELKKVLGGGKKGEYLRS